MTHSELPFATLFGFPFGAQSESEERALVAFGAPVQSAHPRRPGTESGPAAIRQASSDALQAWLSSPSRAAVDLSTGITRRLRDLKASLDLGDLQCDGPVSAKSIAVVAHATAAIVESGGLPVLLGGDQRVFEGLVRGVQGASSPSGHSPGIPCFSDRINLPAAIDSEALPLAALATALDGDCPLLCVGVNGLQSGQAWEALERTGGRIVSADELYDDPAQASVTIKDFLRKHQSIDGHLDFADRLGAWGTHNHATNGRRNSELPNIERANMVWIGITGWVDGDELSHIEGMGGKIFPLPTFTSWVRRKSPDAQLRMPPGDVKACTCRSISMRWMPGSCRAPDQSCRVALHRASIASCST